MNSFGRIGTALVAAVIAASSFGVASAAPSVGKHAEVTSAIELAQYREDRRHDWRRDRDRRDRYERRHYRPGYWNGHHGYRDYRKGYRRHSDGYYYPRSVFQLYIR
jgi:Ni/Co efflux regulator RcnB